jgi:hypothetical protein
MEPAAETEPAVRRQSKAAAAAEARDIELRVRALNAARARTPRLSHALDETWDTLNLTLDPGHRAWLEDGLSLLDVDLGLRELPAVESAQWLIALEWLRTIPVRRVSEP